MLMDKERFRHYRTHVIEIDSQYWDLLEKLSQAKIEISSLATKDLLNRVEHGLLLHFNNENEVMISSNYPFTKFHIEDHRACSVKLNRIIGNVIDNKSIKWIVSDLENLLLSHIDQYDLRFTIYKVVDSQSVVI
jgi:hemerythrin